MKSFGGNSGYCGYSESVRSFEAKEEGRFPKTLFKKEYGLTESVFKKIETAASTGEWHHTSKFGNKTKFYSVTDEVIEVLCSMGGEKSFPKVFEKWFKDYENECNFYNEEDAIKTITFPFEYKQERRIGYSIQDKLKFLEILLSDNIPYVWKSKRGIVYTTTIENGFIKVVNESGLDSYQALLSHLANN